MSYTPSELKPCNFSFEIKNQYYELSLLSIGKETLISKEFGSVSKALDSFAENPMNLYKVAWILLINKSDFDNSIKEFENHIFKLKFDRTNIIELSMKLSEGISYSVRESMPVIKNPKREEEIRRIQEARGEVKSGNPCYGEYFDTIASRYGAYDLEKFYDLTLRQLSILLKQISNSKHDELELEAALAGKELKPRIKYDELSEEEEENRNEQARSAYDTLMERYKAKQKEKAE